MAIGGPWDVSSNYHPQPYEQVHFYQQGWVCPLCQIGIAPSMTFCPFCTAETKTTTSTNITINGVECTCNEWPDGHLEPKSVPCPIHPIEPDVKITY
jgi:hypothetical protein